MLHLAIFAVKQYQLHIYQQLSVVTMHFCNILEGLVTTLANSSQSVDEVRHKTTNISKVHTEHSNTAVKPNTNKDENTRAYSKYPEYYVITMLSTFNGK